MAYCKNCGAQVEEGMAFCMHCGAQIATARQGQAVQQTPQNAQWTQGMEQAVQQTPQNAQWTQGMEQAVQQMPQHAQRMQGMAQGYPAAKKKGSKKGLIIGLCAGLVAVIAAVVVVIVLLTGGGDTRWVLTKTVMYKDRLMRDVSSSSVQEFDDRGNRVRMIYYDADGQQAGRTEWQYNEQNVPVSAARYDGNNQQTVRAEMTWDEGKRQLNMKCYDMQRNLGNLYYEERRTYNETGGLVEQEILKNKSSSQGNDPRTVNQLNSDNKVEGTTAYDANGNILRRTQITLDRYGNAVRRVTTFEDGTTSETNIEYTYDDNGNYVLQISEGANPSSHEWKEVPKTFFWWFINLPMPGPNY